MAWKKRRVDGRTVPTEWSGRRVKWRYLEKRSRNQERCWRSSRIFKEMEFTCIYWRRCKPFKPFMVFFSSLSSIVYFSTIDPIRWHFYYHMWYGCCCSRPIVIQHFYLTLKYLIAVHLLIHFFDATNTPIRFHSHSTFPGYHRSICMCTSHLIGRQFACNQQQSSLLKVFVWLFINVVIHLRIQNMKTFSRSMWNVKRTNVCARIVKKAKIGIK